MPRSSPALLVLLLLGCASAKPPATATASAIDPRETPVDTRTVGLLAPADEPAKKLFDFEDELELRSASAANSKLAVGPEGATSGKRALSVAADGDALTSAGVRFTFAPPQSWAGFNELAVDVTNPGSTNTQVLVSCGGEDEDARRKGTHIIAPGRTVTLRLPLTQGAAPASRAPTGYFLKHAAALPDLAQVKFLWVSITKPANGARIAIDRVRLVKRNSAGEAILPVKRPKLAVLAIHELQPALAKKAQVLTTLAYDEAAAAKTADVIGETDVKELLGVERQRQLLGCQEGSCMAELGGALGAEFILYGELSRLGSRVRVDVRLVEAGKAHVLATGGRFVPASDDDALADATAQLVRQVLHDSPLKPDAAR